MNLVVSDAINRVSTGIEGIYMSCNHYMPNIVNLAVETRFIASEGNVWREL